MILLFNKIDVFKSKLKDFPLEDSFKDYKRSNEEDAMLFIKEMFLNQVEKRENIDVFFINSTCYDDVKNILLKFDDYF
jgi:hypothetical protein